MKEEKTLFSKKSIVLSDTVMVSDPGYTEPTWCQVKLENVKPGRYHIFVDKEGGRCWALVVIHENYLGQNKKWYNCGEVGVDSGQAGIFNYDTYRNDTIVDVLPKGDGDISSPWKEMAESREEEAGERWYMAMCSRTLGKKGWGSYDQGVVSRSGFGDGSYPLKIQKSKGKIVGILIDFGITDVQAKFLEQFIKPETV